MFCMRSFSPTQDLWMWFSTSWLKHGRSICSITSTAGKTNQRRLRTQGCITLHSRFKVCFMHWLPVSHHVPTWKRLCTTFSSSKIIGNVEVLTWVSLFSMTLPHFLETFRKQMYWLRLRTESSTIDTLLDEFSHKLRNWFLSRYHQPRSISLLMLFYTLNEDDGHSHVA